MTITLRSCEQFEDMHNKIKKEREGRPTSEQPDKRFENAYQVVRDELQARNTLLRGIGKSTHNTSAGLSGLVKALDHYAGAVREDLGGELPRALEEFCKSFKNQSQAASVVR